jgi:hypothetical protein
MELTNEMKDALQIDEETEFSFNSASNKWGRDGAAAEAAVTQRPEEMVTTTNPVVGQQYKIEEGNIPSKSGGQPEGCVQTVITPIPEVKEPNSSSLWQMNHPFDIAAITSKLSLIHRHRAAVEKEQEYALKHHDKMQIQHHINMMIGLRPISLTGNVNINVDTPFDALPIQLQALAKSISLSRNVPVDGVIPGLLSTIFMATRGKFQIEVRSGYLEAMTAYFVVAMPSGFKKSSIIQLLRSVFDKFIEKLQDEFDIKFPNQKLLMKLYKKLEKKQLKICADQINVSDQSEINNIIIDMEKSLEAIGKKLLQAASRPLLFNDSPTMKRLAENIMAQYGFLAIFEAEAGIWKLRVRPCDDTILLKAYTMECFGSETSTNGSISIQFPCLAVCSYIQPGVALELYSKDSLSDDGLLHRVLPTFCFTKPDVIELSPQDVDPVLMVMYEQKIISIMEYCWAESGTVKRVIELLQMTDDARNEHFNYSQRVNIHIYEGRFNNCQAFASKLAGHAVRLAAAIHFFEHDKPWDNAIGLSAMKSGIALAEFFAEHAIFAFNKKQNDSFVYASKILDWVKRNRRDVFEPRDAQRGIHDSKSNQIEAGIDLLIKNSYLVQYQNYKGKMVYIVNPNAFREDC